MGLFVAAAPELVKEKRKNKKQGEKRDVEKRTEVVLEVEKGGDEGERGREEGKEYSCCTVVAGKPMFSEQIDSEVITSCARRQQRQDVAQALIRRASAR